MSGEFWKIALPVAAAIITWSLTEWRKRTWEQYRRKEEKYKDLIRCSRGFYEPSTEAEKTVAEKMKAEFLEQLSQCWLYCPDEVIKKAYDYLWTEHDDYHEKDPEKKLKAKQDAMGEFIAAIRKDLLPWRLGDFIAAMREDPLRWILGRQTNLTGADFKHLRSK